LIPGYKVMVSEIPPLDETFNFFCNKFTSQSKALKKKFKIIISINYNFVKILLIFSVASSVKSTAASPIIN